MSECIHQSNGNFQGHIKCAIIDAACGPIRELPGPSMAVYSLHCGACLKEQETNGVPSLVNLTPKLVEMLEPCRHGPPKVDPIGPQRSFECVHLGPIFDRLDCNCQRKWRRKCDVHGETTLNDCEKCQDYLPDDPNIEYESPASKSGASLLIRFPHGLGDTVQLTTVLEHLRRLRPDLGRIAVETKIGLHSCLKGYASEFFLTDRDQHAPPGRFSQELFLPWYEPDASYEGTPATKAEKCLREQFGITPTADWCRYKIPIGSAAKGAAAKYLAGIGCDRNQDGRFNAVILHYFGNTSTWNKNLSNETARATCDAAIALGMRPVIFDWEKRCPFVDGSTVFCPGVDDPLWEQIGTGDSERMAALIEAASLYIGIDSGPDHIAGATTTPSLIVWTGHHPIHYYGLADNVTHLVPTNHVDNIRGDRAVGLKAFEELYRYEVYDDVTNGIVRAMRRILPDPASPLVLSRGYWIRSDNIAQDMVIVNDLDANDTYKLRKILAGREPKKELVVDVGAHIGVFAVCYHRLNPLAKIVCVEACPENLDALRANVGEFATVIHAACTYEPGPVGLLNAVYPDCRSTGGSTVVSADRLQSGAKEGEYWHDLRPLPVVTLEDVLTLTGFAEIALLKLDCEGAEMSIVEKSRAIGSGLVSQIVGEFHDYHAWKGLVASRLPRWKHSILRTGNSGTFSLALR